MNADVLNWPRDSICLRLSRLDVRAAAADIYHRTCRTDFDEPGFCLLNVGDATDSIAFRRLMVELKQSMAAIHEERTGQTLAYLSAARFDQQTTTKLHRDGGPEECFLMLGYEPSEVDGELQIADYTRCAFDLGLTPQEFLARHNPMFRAGYAILEPYITRIPCFSRRDYQIVCVNNSSAAFSRTNSQWQGTLHTATILTPDESLRRVVNSTMIAPAPLGTRDQIDESQLQQFLQSSVVHRRGYDKPHLHED
jgi:hypothetical protein